MRHRVSSEIQCGIILGLVLCAGSAVAQQSNDPIGSEDLAKKVIDIWSSHDVEIVDTVFADDGTYEDVAMQEAMRGKTEIKKFMEDTFTAFPDFDVKLERSFSSENMVGCEWIMSGTHTGDWPGFPATGMPFSVRGASVAVVRDGRVIHWTDYYDRHDLMSQLGAFDKPKPGQESAQE